MLFRSAVLVPRPDSPSSMAVRGVVEDAAKVWAVARHHLYPPSFREGARTVLLVGRKLVKKFGEAKIPPESIWIEVLEYLGRDAFLAEAVAPPLRTPLRCDWCAADAMTKKCTGCLLVRYCGASCQSAAWKTHKKRCRAEQKRRREAAARAAGE